MMRLAVSLMLLALLGCGNKEDPRIAQACQERDVAQQECSRLKAKLDQMVGTGSPEAETVKALQAQVARTVQEAAAEKAQLKQQIEQLENQQVLSELAPLQALLKQQKNEIRQLQNDVEILALARCVDLSAMCSQDDLMRAHKGVWTILARTGQSFNGQKLDPNRSPYGVKLP